jgi:hypothetical protein
MSESRPQTPLPVLSLRWSSVRSCPRKAVYEAIDAPARERTLKEDRQLFRGRSVGHDWVVSVASEKMWKVWIDSGSTHWLPPHLAAVSEDEADVVAELRVQWDFGTGHCDLYIRETDTVVEVLSSQNPSGDMIHSKLIQARGYARALDADNLALIVVDPATLDEERVIVTSGTARWDDLARECDERVAQLVAWRDEGTLPARVCGKPGEAWGHFCQYAEHCFADWQPPLLDVLDSEEAQTLAIRLSHVKAKRREIYVTDRTLEAEQKEIQEELAAEIPVPGEFQVGGFKVKRSDRAGRRSFAFDRAENDSRIAELLNEFVKPGNPYTVWDVEQTGPVLVLPDDEAPWTDADLEGRPGDA